MVDVDPNRLMRLNRAIKTWKLVFGIWTYRKTVVVRVCENRGCLDSLSFAVETVFESIPLDGNITLKGPDGEIICGDDEGVGEEWLQDMLVSAELIAVEPVGKITDPYPVFDPFPKQQGET